MWMVAIFSGPRLLREPDNRTYRSVSGPIGKCLELFETRRAPHPSPIEGEGLKRHGIAITLLPKPFLLKITFTVSARFGGGLQP